MLALAAVIPFGESRASATTGPSDYLPAAHSKVAHGTMASYVGQYVLTSVASGARLSGGAMGIEIGSKGYLYGVGQFYGYDSNGSQSTWTATLYNFRTTKAQPMAFDLLGPSAKIKFGQILISKRLTSGDLTGQIQLTNGRFAIHWHKISAR